jgi:hypothetical protein
MTDTTKHPWQQVTDSDVREAISGTPIEIINNTLAAVADPPLPLALTLGKTLTLIGTALAQPMAGYDPEDAADTRRGADIARLRINTAGGQVCNAWTLCVAPSGSFKDAGNVPDRLAFDAGWSIGTSGSAEGLADAFTGNGGGLLTISEFTPFLKAKTWEHAAQAFLTSSFNKGFFRVSLSKRSGGEGREARYCFPSIIANIQPETLAENATPSEIDSGFLPRFLITRLTERQAWRPTTARVDLSTVQGLLANYSRLQGAVSVPDRYLDDVYTEFLHNDAPLPGHYSRLVNEYGPRFAVMLAGSTELEAEDWNRAAVLIRWFFSQAEVVLADIGRDSDQRKTDDVLARMLKFIEKRGSVTKTEFARAFSRNVLSYQRNRLLQELQDRGDITIYEHSTGTKIHYGQKEVPQKPATWTVQKGRKQA